ncbi:serine/threonine protein kinase [Silvibacterium bohemicum]|uniref:Serine/threonine protein kinase n=1 Tax=Silvibacterium bohemicum TaxID=1577686 RepID=A0A841K3C6_9BACT|nr:tetratricopeptide repeat protein [Silvibacterium bohemicum]MBB6146439.1 serine/threonine protein kinase [Silvibacterium bohemicum]
MDEQARSNASDAEVRAASGGDVSFPEWPVAVDITSAAPHGPTRRAEGIFPATTLRLGEVLVGRFAVIRMIGRGGMGEVYEVEDRHLQGVRVALKTLLPRIAADADAQRSLEHEVLLARSVTHPNLCPIYDIARSESSGQSLLFLTMRLLPGDTLAARLEQPAKLSLAEAEIILRKVAAGLSAAHAAGIIHRDIKPNNIMIDGSGIDVQVWITDFGLARSFSGETSILNALMIAGTPGYLAPELFRGQSASICSDIYAFGVVAEKVFAATERPPSAAWTRVVEGCLEPEPSERFSSIDDALALLDGNAATRLGERLLLSRRGMLVLTSGAAAAVCGGIAFEVYNKSHALPPLPKKRFVALLAWPQTAEADRSMVANLLDSIGNRLSRAEAYATDLLIISSPDFNTAPNYNVSPASLVTSLGANLALAGSLIRTRLLITLTLEILDAETSNVLRKDHVSVLSNAIGGLADKAANLAAAMLELPKDVSLADPDELQRVPAAVFRAYTEARQMVDQPNDTALDAGIRKYQQILTDMPRFALGYAQLSLAYTRQYLLRHEPASLHLAESNADLALKYNPQSAKGLLSKGLSLLYSGKTDEALNYLTQALKADPENPDTRFHKAQAYEYLNRWKDAEEVYRQILKSRPNYWPAHNDLGWALFRQARYKEAAQAFEDASIVAPQVAMPLANLGTMYVELGRNQDAMESFRKSLSRHPNEIAYLGLGDIAFSSKDFKTALFNYSKAKEVNPASDLAWRNLGDTYSMLGNPKEMLDCYGNAARIMNEKVRVNPSDGIDWMTLAFYNAKLGNAANAWDDLKQADTRGAADVESQFTKAQALALLGKKEESLQLVLACMARGLDPLEIELALDLKDVRLDPRYKSAAAKTHVQGPT